ncbi:uncharacterized protein [Argopecten irradians]|uniref:uncharacterized protein n=1 Tax=Argopecten irradians TaxID=31199 RepID=UPI00371653DB
MENEEETMEKDFNTDEEDNDDDDDDDILDFEDDDDGDDIDMDDIRLFDEEELCGGDMSQSETESLEVETESLEVEPDTRVDTGDAVVKQELCPPDNVSVIDTNEIPNQENLSETSNIELKASVYIDNNESQGTVEELSSKENLPEGQSQNVSLQTNSTIKEEIQGNYPRENEGVQLDIIIPKTESNLIPKTVSSFDQDNTTKSPNPETENLKMNLKQGILDQQVLSEDVQSDIDDIKLVKPKERKSPRKAVRGEKEVGTPISEITGNRVEGSDGQTTIKPTMQLGLISNEPSLSEVDSAKVTALDGHSPASEVEKDVENRKRGDTGRQKCYLCDLVFNSKANLTVHRRTVHSFYSQIPPFGCTHCGTQFESDELVYKHERDVHSFDTACAFCGKNQLTTEALQVHVCNHLQPLTYLCMFCREDFPTVVEAEEHLSKHKGEVAFWTDFLKCRLCGSLFSKRDKLYTHVMTVHEDLFQVKCRSCSQCFFMDWALAVHRSDQSQMLDGKKIRVCENIPIQFDVTSSKVSKESIDITADGSVESHNEKCALKLKKNCDSAKFNNENKSIAHGKDITAERSGGDSTSNSNRKSDHITHHASPVKQSLMAKVLAMRNDTQKMDDTSAKSETLAVSGERKDKAKKDVALLVPDSLEDYFQRIMFRIASNIQDLLKFSLTIEGHVTQQSHQFLAKVYEEKFKVVVAIWGELQHLTKAVETDLFAKGNQISQEVVDSLLFRILEKRHTLRQSKMETIELMGECVVKSFQEMIKVMVGKKSIVTPGLQMVAIKHYEQWLDYFPIIVDSQWNVFKETATYHSDRNNHKVLEMVGRSWHSKVTLSEAIALKKEEIKQWKEGVHPAAFKINGKTQGVEPSKQILFRMTKDTAVYVSGKTTPVEIGSVAPGSEIMIPVGKLLSEKPGKSVNILPGTQSANSDNTTIRPPPVAHLPGFLSNEQPEDGSYRLAYISEGFLQGGISPLNVPKVEPSISIDLTSDGEDENGNKSVKSADDLLMLDCTEEDPMEGDEVSNHVTDQETVMELDCVEIKPEPMDYHNATVDLCVVDDDDDEETDDNNEEFKVVLAEDNTSPEERILNETQIKQETSSESNGSNDTSADPVLSIKQEKTSPTNTCTTKRPQTDAVTANMIGPPNKRLKLVQVFNDGAFENVSTPTTEGETTPAIAVVPSIKTESIKGENLGETTPNVNTAELHNANQSHSKSTVTDSIVCPFIKSEPKESTNEASSTGGENSMGNSKSVSQDKLTKKIDNASEVFVKSESCDSTLSNMESKGSQSDCVVTSIGQSNAEAIKSEPKNSERSGAKVSSEPQSISEVVKSESCDSTTKDSEDQSERSDLPIKSEPVSDAEALKLYYS